MNKKLVALLLVFIAWFFGENPNPPNSDDEIFLYRAVQTVKPGHLPLNQGQIGTCVAVAHAAACDVRLALDKLSGKSAKWLPSSPESIYGGARNEGANRISRSYSDGSSGFAATRWLTNVGGVLYKQAYPEHNVDLSNYDVPRAKEWGAFGNGGRADGLGGPLDQEAKKHPCKAALVKSLEELDVALKNGWPVTICSSVGFNSPRDKDGFCAPRGSWSHCMAVLGKRDEGRKGYLIQNSWGKYIDGDGPDSKNKYKDQPDGSFYIEPAVMQRILNAGDSWAITNHEGFKRNILPSWLTNPNGTAPSGDGESLVKPVPVIPASHKFGQWVPYDEARAALDSGSVVVVMVSASWCGACPAAAKAVEAIAGDAVLTKLDVGDDRAKQLEPRLLPAFYVYGPRVGSASAIYGNKPDEVARQIKLAK